MLTLAKVNKAINAKYPGVQLTKGEGYFYLYSDDKEIGLKICGLYTSSIGVFAINHLNLEQWLMHVNRVLNDAERLETEREPVFAKKEWFTIKDQTNLFEAFYPFYTEGNKVFGWLHDANKKFLTCTLLPVDSLELVK